jgi:hypothetical protein
VEPPGGESGNIEHTWGMYNKPAGCSTPVTGPNTNKQAVRAVRVSQRNSVNSAMMLARNDEIKVHEAIIHQYIYIEIKTSGR